MNFLQRAIKNVTRKLSKSILLLLTFFVIGNFVIVGLGVSQASENAKVMTRQKMRAVVSYEIDYDAINEYVNSLTDQDAIDEFYNNGYPNIKLSDVKPLLEDERVLTANALTTTQLYATEGSDFVHLGNQVEEDLSSQEMCYVDPDGNQVCEPYNQPTYFLKANYFPNMIEFQEGSYNIVDGRFYTQDEINDNAMVVLVSQALADLNGWRVGDVIDFYSSDPSSIEPGGYMGDMGITTEDITMSLEIIGIYTHNQAITPSSENFDWTYPYENPDNMLLMPGTSYAAHSLARAEKSWDYYASQFPDDPYYTDPANRPTAETLGYIGNVTILLNDPLDVDSFVADYSDDIPEFMMINANNEEFERLSKPLDTISLFANFIVWLVVINAVVIITLVTALTLKTREYEIGVLLSIGASKLKIIGQFFVELAIVAVIGFTLSIFSGSLVAGKVGEVVLDYQITESGVAEENDYMIGYPSTSIWDTDYTTDITLDDLVGEYSVSISPLIIAEIYVVGLGIVLVSTLIPSLMIMRFNPKKILMNQN